MKIKKVILGIVLSFFLLGICATSIHAEPTTPLPTAPVILNPPVSGQPPVPVAAPDMTAGQKAPNQPTSNVLNPTVGTPSIPFQPPDPNQPGKIPDPIPMTPPPPLNQPVENPVKNYQTSWFTSPIFLMAIVILLVIIVLVVYSLREGKPPSEEKEVINTSKKKKSNKK